MIYDERDIIGTNTTYYGQPHVTCYRVGTETHIVIKERTQPVFWNAGDVEGLAKELDKGEVYVEPNRHERRKRAKLLRQMKGRR